MTIDVSTILKELGGKIDINGDVEMSDTDFLGEMYHFNEPVKVSGSVSNNGKSLILKANCTGHMTTQCARCMKDIVVDIDFDIDENLAQDDGSVSSDDDVILFEDVKIDIDDIVANNFLMNVEGKYLCSEDCKGLCQHCGADLNEGDCGCSQENIDPRWAALVDIMEKDKDILKQVGRDTGMRVPDGYFEGFTSRMVSQLDNFEVVEPEKPTVWQRVRPWLYMAAMFAGIALMVRLFVPEKDSSSVVAETEVSITNENVDDYLFYSNVDEYSVYEYLALGE